MTPTLMVLQLYFPFRTRVRGFFTFDFFSSPPHSTYASNPSHAVWNHTHHILQLAGGDLSTPTSLAGQRVWQLGALLLAADPHLPLSPLYRNVSNTFCCLAHHTTQLRPVGLSPGQLLDKLFFKISRNRVNISQKTQKLVSSRENFIPDNFFFKTTGGTLWF